MSSTGTPPAQQTERDHKRKFHRNLIAALAVIGVFVVVALAVSLLRKPGQMGVIESQSMDMSKMAPPQGAVPVQLSTVEYREVTGQLTYTGTVQAYSDEDIYPRITGRITQMLVYPGDRVKRGQLLIVLDPTNSEYAAKATVARDKAQAAAHNVEIARQDYQEKKQQSEAVAETQTQSQKAVDEAKANLTYWTAEIEREKFLLDRAAIAKQEYDNELAQFKEAQDKVAQAEAKVREAAKTKLAAKAAAVGMQQHIHHQQEEAEAAAAEAQAAAIQQSYTRIVASDDGVVTKRLISPGVVVDPGMLILKLAHINRVRVQAQISNSDVHGIEIGAPVQIKADLRSPDTINGTVTAIFPSADATSRTITVESLIPNPGYKLIPGQYAVMTISTGSKRALTVPTSAVVSSDNHARVWKAVGSGSRKVVQLVDVQTGLTSADQIEIVSGLQKGDQVVAAGQSDLQPGMAVIGVEWGTNGPIQLPTASQAAGARLDASNKWTLEQSVNGLTVKLWMSPAPPKNGANSLMIKVANADGRTVSGADVSATTSMPTMNMAGPDLNAKTSGDGVAQLAGNFMTTIWEVKLTIKAPGAQATPMSVDVEVP